MNIDLCKSIGANTGIVKCDRRRDVPVLFLLGTKEFTEEEYCGDMRAAILAAVALPNGAPGKLYPVRGVENVVDNTAENTTGTTGLGRTITFSEGKPNYQFGLITGINTEIALRKFNRSNIPVFVIDRAGQMWGWRKADGSFAGYSAEPFTDGKPFSDGASVDTAYTNFNLAFEDVTEFFDAAAVKVLDFPSSDIQGLLDAELYLISNAGEEHVFGVRYRNAELCNDVDLIEEYGAILADAGNFAGANYGPAATPLTVTAVSQGGGGIEVTYDAVTYAAIPEGTLIRQPFAPPATLAEAGLTGTEVQGLNWNKSAPTT